MYSPTGKGMKLPSREGVTSRVRVITIPVDEALKIDQRNALGGLAVQCVGIAGCTRHTVLCGLPVMINLEMNPAVTGRVFGCCARRTVVEDNGRVVDVEGEIVDSHAAVGSSSVCRIIAGGRVLKNRTCSLDTVNLNKDSLLLSGIIGDGTGWTWRMPA